MRVAGNDVSLRAGLSAASAEAEKAFNNAGVYLEKFVERPRHIEVQVLGDGKGGAIHLGTRDCSVQRRFQKVVEEAPAADIPEASLQALSERCAAAISSLAYRNAATLEFLYADGEFHFLEINTRLQVEHPVTELITGIDVVAAQIRLAAGDALPDQASVGVSGHAIECRINAETHDFMPSPGTVTGLKWPGGPGVRIDSHLYAGYRIPHEYDSLVAKLVVWAPDRSRAISRMQRALDETHIDGVETNLSRLRAIVDHTAFQTMRHHTTWLDTT